MTEDELLAKLAKVKNVTVRQAMFGTIIQFWYPYPHNAHSFMLRADGKWYHENGWDRKAHSSLVEVVKWAKANDPTKTTIQGEQ